MATGAREKIHVRIIQVSKMFSAAALAAVFTFASWAKAADNAPAGRVTFNKDVLPIFQKNCQACHRPGGANFTGMVAPMSLLTYEETRPWAKSIAVQVSSRAMPPWFASSEFHGRFSNERTLTDAEIATVVKWVQSGVPRGNPEDAPEPLVFSNTDGWRIGVPDLIVTSDPFFVPDDATDLYTNFDVQLTEEQLPEDQWIQAIEWQGGSSAVHHIVGYAYVAGESDAEGSARSGIRYGLGSIAPGEEPMEFPVGYAKRLLKGSRILFSMHYNKEPGPGTGLWDRSRVAFKFHPKDEAVRHFVDHSAIGNAGFEIPPGHSDWRVGASRIFDSDTTLLAMHPHMHLRGKQAKYEAFYPDGTREVLLYVPEYDFSWQTDYKFDEPKLLPAGTRLEYTAHFDNSLERGKLVPELNVSRSVRFGGPTTDEMMLGYITYTNTQPEKFGDAAQVRARISAGSRRGF